MTEADKLREKLAAARQHPDYARAMQTPPVTWLKAAIGVTVGIVVSLAITFAIYPWEDMAKMPASVKPILMFSWIPTIGAVIGVLWLLVDAIGLSLLPTRHVLAVLGRQVDTPAPYGIRLLTEDGGESQYRARRRAASVVKLRLLTPGDVGVAVFKGDVCVEWVALQLPVERIYDRR